MRRGSHAMQGAMMDRTMFVSELNFLGMSQRDFARLVGKSHVTVRAWGHGRQIFPSWLGPFLGSLKALKRQDAELDSLRAEVEALKGAGKINGGALLSGGGMQGSAFEGQGVDLQFCVGGEK